MVPHPRDQFIISEDAVGVQGKPRAYRIFMMQLCKTCMEARQQELRPSEMPGQMGML